VRKNKFHHFCSSPGKILENPQVCPWKKSFRRPCTHPHCFVLKCTDWSLQKIRQLSDATQACSRSPTNVQNYGNNSGNWAPHPTNRRNDYYVTHGHSTSRWTWHSRHAAAPWLQSIDQCWVCACKALSRPVARILQQGG